ncbi:type II secretion system protein GspJ [Halieaceae bacterium IMCC14734]|uniref:Type II secretion system protein GspJ n=1 Tax=Candidatus Litorirhabdus singularis TaxID=2518993 RepID=A0ABT3TI43_9GAMM|nr:type II secretion system minor pseudopilin GspJ [Candidatus Litorirhabdus singularis]MCX2981047.1 type II secretion system protein GspJ [Candidatus Litorirhabdus singularis]
MRADSSPGFTLIEVLIAMGATLLIVSVAFATFTNLLSGIETLRSSGGQATELNRTWMLLGRDLRQFVNRPVRDEFGTLESAMIGGELADNSLSFTRIGWHNPNAQPRSHLQRVRYELEENILWRVSYVVLDRTDSNEPARVELLSGVERFEVAFLGPEQELREGDFDSRDWPRNWALDPLEQGVLPPPEAVEIVIELAGMGELRRLYELPESE